MVYGQEMLAMFEGGQIILLVTAAVLGWSRMVLWGLKVGMICR